MGQRLTPTRTGAAETVMAVQVRTESPEIR